MSTQYMHEGAKLAALARKAGLYKLDGVRRENGWGSWYQNAIVDGRKYTVCVEMGQRVRLRYKPAGSYGAIWHGRVVSADGYQLWAGQVDKSAGVFAILGYAGLVPTKWVGRKLVEWGEAMRKLLLEATS